MAKKRVEARQRLETLTKAQATSTFDGHRAEGGVIDATSERDDAHSSYETPWGRAGDLIAAHGGSSSPAPSATPDPTSTATVDDDSGQQPFDHGGVVLGYYGPPWSHSERMASLAWMAEQGMNTFVFAPKDDPYQRANWRDPYPDELFEQFQAEVAFAREHDVEWVPNISPGFPLIPSSPAAGTTPSRDICFSCPDDRAVLFEKLDRFWEAGVRTLMVSLDDVQKISTHPEDAETYGVGDEAYGRMNRDLLNAVYDRYGERDSSFTLLTVLADYEGTEDTAYLQGVRSGPGLREDIEVMWTGPAVWSPTISAEGAAAFAELVDRDEVLIWDNYPVHDIQGGGIEQPVRLFLGPYAGRAPDLPESVSGILANPMYLPRASRIPLGAVARYLQDPAGYDAERAWRASIGAEGGPAADALAAFAENSRSSFLDRTAAPVFTAARDEFLEAYDTSPFWLSAAERFRSELERERAAPAELDEHCSALLAEMTEFVDQFRSNVGTSVAGVDVLTAQRPSLTVTAERQEPRTRIEGVAKPPSMQTAASRFERFASAYEETWSDHPAQMHGDRYSWTLSSVHGLDNRVDEFAQSVVERTAGWAPVAGAASQDIDVFVDSEPVEVDSDGHFETTVLPSERIVDVVAIDGADGQTGRRVDTRTGRGR